MKILILFLMPLLLLAQSVNDAEKLFNDGNYQEALNAYEKYLSDGSLKDPAKALKQARDCINKLNKNDAADALIKKAVTSYPNNFELLWAAAQLYLSPQPILYFRPMFVLPKSNEKNRIKSLQLYEKASQLTVPQDSKISFYTDFSNALLIGRNQPQNCWLLQNLTNFYEIAEDLQEDLALTLGAPVGENNLPIFYSIPESFTTAKNDGERLRWIFNLMNSDGEILYAKFLNEIFGPNLLNSNYQPQLKTLKDDETITTLATGVNRFSLPNEHNPIKILQKLTNNVVALDLLANIYSSRENYVKALACYREIEKLDPKFRDIKDKIAVIANNWCQLQFNTTQLESRGSNINFKYRNASKASFSVKRINEIAFFNKLKEFYKNNNHKRYNSFYNLAKILLEKSWGEDFLSPQIAQWEVDLNPGSEHFDQEMNIVAPLQKSGFYFVTATVNDGNSSSVILNLENTKIIRKNSKDGMLYLICDAATGKPLPKIKVEVFGIRDKKFINFAEFTDVNGIVAFSKDIPNNGYIMVSEKKRFAVQQLNYYHYRNNVAENFARNVVVTDRPVYKPNQQVQFQAWCGYNDYALHAKESFNSNKKVNLSIKNSRHEEVFSKDFTTNVYGSFDGSFSLPSYSQLGMYYVLINNNYVSNFRVEEYKKPEYTVNINAPKKPIMLGESFDVTIDAQYYFGQPVTNAQVKVKVMRYLNDEPFYPFNRWDYLYGRGFNPVLKCCFMPPYIPQYLPPEEVINTTANLDENGKFSLKIDSAELKKTHGNYNHRYEVTAEVIDLSRSTIFAKNSIIASKSPFEIFCALENGFYEIGNKIVANIKAFSLDNSPILGDATLSLSKVSYDYAGKMLTEPLKQWNANCDNDGNLNHIFAVESAGRYQLEISVTHQNFTQKKSLTFDVHGQGFNSNDYHYNALEIIPEKATYAPADNLKLKISTARPNSTIFLFTRPQNGIVSLPSVINLTEKSTIIELPINEQDQPNIFIEALTVCENIVHNNYIMIPVPPKKRQISVTLTSNKSEFQPKENAEIKLQLKSLDGKPLVGNVAVSVYDKSLEAIASNNNSPLIQNVWGNIRNHYINTFSNSAINNQILYLANQPQMPPLNFNNYSPILGARRNLMGAFSDSVAAPMNSMKSESASAVSSEVTVRTDFADSAFWQANLQTNENGQATINFTLPENLTTWKIVAYAVADDFAVGQSETEITSSKNFITRLQTPRFLVENDKAIISANIHNYLPKDQKVAASLQIDNVAITSPQTLSENLAILANSQARLSWLLHAKNPGLSDLILRAKSKDANDGVKQTIPILIHGTEKLEAKCGQIAAGETSLDFDFKLPKLRKDDSTSLTINVSPSLALSMIDAIPFLIENKSSCSEQTLNRFLPLTIINSVLNSMKIDLTALAKTHSNLNSQQIGAVRKFNKNNPIYDRDSITKITKENLEKLYQNQNPDGGWSWFFGGNSDLHTTCLIVRGLKLANENNIAVLNNVLQNGVNYLQNYQNEIIRKRHLPKEDPKSVSTLNNLDALVAYVLPFNKKVATLLFNDRKNLSNYAKTLTAISMLNQEGFDSELAMLERNVSQFLTYDEENQTAFISNQNSSPWHWFSNNIETNAAYLSLLTKTKPHDKITAGLVKYLLNNRQNANYWHSTRDTALCIEAFAHYLNATSEHLAHQNVQIFLNQKLIKTIDFTPENIFSTENSITINHQQLSQENQKISIKKSVGAPLYANAYLQFFSQEKFIKETGLELKVTRDFYQITSQTSIINAPNSHGIITQQKSSKIIRTKILPNHKINPGDIIEVQLSVESKNDYEYIIINDFKAAGLEPLQNQSGYQYQMPLTPYVEFANTTTNFYIQSLPRGTHTFSYQMQALTPGTFSALPTKISAMYAPELRANSHENIIQINE